MARAMSVAQVLNKKRKLAPFEDEWKRCFGCPELAGAWFIHGESGNGKTTFVLELSKYLTNFARVAYNSMEEGDSESMKIALSRVNMLEVRRKFVLLDNEPIEELKERLRKHKAPRIVVIDSIQYTGMNYKAYTKLRDEFRHVLFIIISHADGKKPSGRTATNIRYDASIKIRVEGYKAFVVSRYTTSKEDEYVIWEEGANAYHGADLM